jgi:hypothetical protein
MQRKCLQLVVLMLVCIFAFSAFAFAQNCGHSPGDGVALCMCPHSSYWLPDGVETYHGANCFGSGAYNQWCFVAAGPNAYDQCGYNRDGSCYLWKQGGYAITGFGAPYCVTKNTSKDGSFQLASLSDEKCSLAEMLKFPELIDPKEFGNHIVKSSSLNTFPLKPSKEQTKDGQQVYLTGSINFKVLIGVDGKVLKAEYLEQPGDSKEYENDARENLLKEWQFKATGKVYGIVARVMNTPKLPNMEKSSPVTPKPSGMEVTQNMK